LYFKDGNTASFMARQDYIIQNNFNAFHPHI